MILCTSVKQAQAVPNVVLAWVRGANVEAYQQGDTMPAEYLATLVPPSSEQMTAAARAAAVASLVTDEPDDKRFKSIVQLMLDEINTVRAKLVPPLVARTLAQLNAAITAKINAGLADG